MTGGGRGLTTGRRCGRGGQPLHGGRGAGAAAEAGGKRRIKPRENGGRERREGIGKGLEDKTISSGAAGLMKAVRRQGQVCMSRLRRSRPGRDGVGTKVKDPTGLWKRVRVRFGLGRSLMLHAAAHGIDL
ncbi:unnamed protein product [Arctogadus glacialis]